MKIMKTRIHIFPEMKHVFFMFCDGHDLQLLLNDIMRCLFFDDVVQKTQSIMTNFRAFNKELAILWKYQMKIYHERRSFVLNITTRWGTTVGLLTSVLKNREALMKYFRQKKPGINKRKSHSLGLFVRDYAFWDKLIFIKKTIDFIHQFQYLSEAENHKFFTIAGT